MFDSYDIPPDAANGLKTEFLRLYPDFSSFDSPGVGFERDELMFKRKILGRFQEALSIERIEDLLQEGKGREVLEKMVQCSGGMVHFTSWDRTFGKDDTTRTATLSVLLEVTRGAWQGAVTLEPLFHCFRLYHRRPSWDALSVALWLFRPADYFPVKISAFRKLAKEELGAPLGTGAPQPDRFAELMAFVNAFRPIIQDWQPRDTIDLQSFIYALASRERGGIGAPLNEVFDSREEAHQVFGLFRLGMEKLGVALGDCEDPRMVITLPQNTGPEYPKRMNLIFGNWPVICFLAPYAYDTRFEFVCYRESVPECARLQKGKNQYPPSAWDEVRPEYDYAWVRVKLEDVDRPDVRKAFVQGMERMGQKFKDWKGCPYRNRHVPELLTAAYDADFLDALLSSGLPEMDECDADDPVPEESTLMPHQGCTLEEAMGDVFMDAEDFRQIVVALRHRLNVILQGAPGTGKTYAARRIAYALLGERDPQRVKMVQFHQSYGYEDFIQGWRPNESGGFILHDGHFKRFCERAENDQTRPYVFIIDEINRGNLSRIFGELMVLMEVDKRGLSMPLTYSPDDEFMIPPNVHILGLMNTADRSLAVVDYALRRRFSFASLSPCFDSPKFAEVLGAKNVSLQCARKIRVAMSELNHRIGKDLELLGPGCQIGHSFFVPNKPVEDEDRWYRDVVKWEILPLLEEYWVDAPEKIAEAQALLLNQ